MNDLLVFNLATDADDPVLGFTTRWLNELALHYDHIDVVTMRRGRLALAANVAVYSVGKEDGANEAARALAFYGILRRLLRGQRYVGCFAHMMPLFAAMGAPLLALARVPITLWYVHRQNTRVLRLAERAAQRVLTASADSFPFPTPKLCVVGHGIDTAFFHPAGAAPELPFRVVQVARLSPIKHQDVLLRASAGLPVEVVLIGGTNAASDTAYEAGLRRMARDPARRVPAALVGSLSAAEVIARLHRAHAAVNLSPPGLFDKAALEAMACGLPTLVASDGFSPVLGPHDGLLRVAQPQDVDGVRQRLERLLALAEEERRQIGAHLRHKIVEQHSLPALIRRIAALIASRPGERL